MLLKLTKADGKSKRNTALKTVKQSRKESSKKPEKINSHPGKQKIARSYFEKESLRSVTSPQEILTKLTR